MKKKAFIIFVGSVILGISACSKNDPILFNSGMNFIAFSETSLKGYENFATVNTPIVLGATANAAQTVISIGTSADGIENPAIEGVDYTIATKELQTVNGIAEVIIHPVDNADTTGDKSFYVFITGNSAGYRQGGNDTVRITLRDDEHPLGQWIGEYNVEAVSYYDPGNYDEQWLVNTESDPKNVNVLILNGIGNTNASPVRATVNKEAMTISIAPGQNIGMVYTNFGSISIYKGTSAGDGLVENEPITGTLDVDGTIRIDLWGHLIMDGQYAGYIWDVFNTTWIKQ